MCHIVFPISKMFLFYFQLTAFRKRGVHSLFTNIITERIPAVTG